MKRATRKELESGVDRITPWAKRDILDSDAKQAATIRALRKGLNKLQEVVVDMKVAEAVRHAIAAHLDLNSGMGPVAREFDLAALLKDLK